MIETMKLDVHASEQDVFKATLESCSRKRARPRRIRSSGYSTRLGAAGWRFWARDDTLEALANGQVDELLITGSLSSAIRRKRRSTPFLRPRFRIPAAAPTARSPGGLPFPIC